MDADIKDPVGCLPGCTQPVTAWGRACSDCLAVRGDYLATAKHAVPRSEQQIADELAARDAGAVNAYAQQAAIRSGARAFSAAADRRLRHTLELREGPQGRVQRTTEARAVNARRRNQVRWVFTNRKTFNRRELRLECDERQKIQ